MEAFSLDRVEFMVAHSPPHKMTQEPSDSYHRYAMVALGLSEEEKMTASSLELKRRGISYTIDTMETLTASNPLIEYCFVAGSDALKEIHLWKDYDRLLTEHCFIFVQRPEEQTSLDNVQWPEDLLRRIRKVSRSSQPEISKGQSFLISLDALPISATEIRLAISGGQILPQNVLAPEVIRYIRKHNLYG